MRTTLIIVLAVMLLGSLAWGISLSVKLEHLQRAPIGFTTQCVRCWKGSCVVVAQFRHPEACTSYQAYSRQADRLMGPPSATFTCEAL